MWPWGELWLKISVFLNFCLSINLPLSPQVYWAFALLLNKWDVTHLLAELSVVEAESLELVLVDGLDHLQVYRGQRRLLFGELSVEVQHVLSALLQEVVWIKSAQTAEVYSAR